MPDMQRHMPSLARHEGVWDGVYRYYDAEGNKYDEHRSRLICRFTGDEKIPYHQTNQYSWADGKTEVRDFPTRYQFGRIIFDNELIYGWCAELPEDDHHRSLMLYWERVSDPGVWLYEMIQLSDCGRYRNRVWHWFRDGKLFQRTLIDEEFVTRDWRKITGHSFAGEAVDA
ncbi:MULTISPECIES: hypothetical protein [unclassified Lysobacter]